MYTIFTKALTWNSRSIFFYKMSLLAHQIILYSIISKTYYGIQSSLFACIYTIIAFTNFGLEESLLYFFPLYTANKQQFQKLLYLLYIHTITLLAISWIFYATLLYGPGDFLHNIQAYCNKNIILIIAYIFFIEGIKKTCTLILQLKLMHEQVAYAQIGMICTYITFVWGWYTLTQTITLQTIFVPMLITSAAELCYISYNVANIYMSLPEAKDTPSIPFKALAEQRFYNYINQINKALYSPNMITLWFAWCIGFEQAATIKLYTTIITLAYACLTKIIGVSTGVTFSAMRNIHQKETQKFFHMITYKYFKLLYLFSSLFITIVGYAWYQEWITLEIAWYILLFFLINLLENLTLIYEQFFSAHGKAWYIASINSGGLLLMSLCMYIYIHNLINQLFFIGIFIIIKLIAMYNINKKTARL